MNLMTMMKEQQISTRSQQNHTYPGLESQITSQETFQNLLHHHQFSSSDAAERVLLVQPRSKKGGVYDGFTLEFQIMARQFQIAFATNRRLEISSQWRSAYEFPDCTTTGWTCLWQPLNGTNATTKTDTSSQAIFKSLSSKQSYGILPNRDRSNYFNVQYFGNTSLVNAPEWPWDSKQTIDIIPHWERTYGRFWIRSQIVHFLWSRPSSDLRREIEERTPALPEQYIGFHIRYSDNIADLNTFFARDAKVTRNFAHFMSIAESIRSTSDNSIDTIFVATDNSNMIDETARGWPDWNFVFQKEVQRSTTTKRTWYKSGRGTAAGAIATDVDVLRRANFLVGSFQSNVYRLSTELNTAYHVRTYPTTMERHFSVDVEWYEDP